MDSRWLDSSFRMQMLREGVLGGLLQQIWPGIHQDRGPTTERPRHHRTEVQSGTVENPWNLTIITHDILPQELGPRVSATEKLDSMIDKRDLEKLPIHIEANRSRGPLGSHSNQDGLSTTPDC